MEFHSTVELGGRTATGDLAEALRTVPETEGAVELLLTQRKQR